MSASPPPKSLWSTHKNPEGRVYWSHAVTKKSVWEKPDELRTAFELALTKTDWKQYVSKDRTYYVNSKTRETKWDLPAELQDLKRRVDREEAYQLERERRKRAGERR
jgi:pre-mRNA-processing factor 40